MPKIGVVSNSKSQNCIWPSSYLYDCYKQANILKTLSGVIYFTKLQARFEHLGICHFRAFLPLLNFFFQFHHILLCFVVAVSFSSTLEKPIISLSYSDSTLPV